MRFHLPGVDGTLFPGRYLSDQLIGDAALGDHDEWVATRRRGLLDWWRRVESTCGPATGLRALFDVVAMPLAAILGFRARDVRFDRTRACVLLETAHGAPVGLMVSRWAHRAPEVWRDANAFARDIRASWCLVLAPPWLSVLDARGEWTRRSVDFRFPHVLETAGSAAVLLALVDAAQFDSGTTVPPIEQLVLRGAGFQDRVRDDLQRGVHAALASLGRVIRRRRATDGEIVDEALTIVYRVLFLLFVESRDLVPCQHPVYDVAYSIGSLCRTALGRAGAPGLWTGLAAITRLLRHGCTIDDLIVRPFNGRLFARASAPSLERPDGAARDSRSGNARDLAVGEALVALSTRTGRHGRDPITYADLGVEQLGAVYERVLDLDPAEVAAHPPRTSPALGHSARRKQSGTFYTPRSLTEFVVRRTLAPLVANAPSTAILSLRVVDPAMGSGAFLVAACHYLTAAYERALIREGRISESDIDDGERASMRRLVAQHCLYGVDANPVAVHLARLSLWLTTLSEGRPLSFLDHRLRTGNSLIGIAPDDLRTVSDARRTGASLPLFDRDLADAASLVAAPLAALADRADDTAADVRAKETIWARISSDQSPLHAWRLASHLWCARWFTPAESRLAASEVRAGIDALVRNDQTLPLAHVSRLVAAARSAHRRHAFFHWPLEFADVFYDERGEAKAQPGFDAVIGNPPWEMLRTDHDKDGGAGRLVRFVRDSGLYPSCDRGHVNLYQPFVDRALMLARPHGRVGLVLPWGLATDDGATALRARLFDHCETTCIVGLDNASGLFPVHRGLRFMVVVTSPGGRTREVNVRCGISTGAQLEQIPEDGGGPVSTAGAAVGITPALLELLSGPARRVPDVRRPGDLDLVSRLASRFPALGHVDGWNVRFGRELNATEDRASFGDRGLPVLEGKNIEPFRINLGVNADAGARRISLAEASRLLPDKRFEHARIGYRDVSGVGNKLSLIAAVIPRHHVTTHTLYCLRTPIDEERQDFLCAILNSYVANIFVRMLMGGHVTTSLIERLPVPVWTGSPAERRVARLAHRVAHVARPSPIIAATIQADVARLYGLDADSFAAIVETFPLVDEAERAAAIRWFRKGASR